MPDPALADDALALERFREAVAAMPDVAERLAAGQQFNDYPVTDGCEDLDDDPISEVAVCLGPITSRPLSFATTVPDVAELLTSALRLAAARLRALSTPPAAFTVDDLAQEIRRVDGSNSMGAGALAEALTPFLLSRGGE